MRSPLLVGVGAGLGVVAATVVASTIVSKVAMMGAKAVIARRKAAVATPCAACRATGYLPCQVCRGRAVITCRVPRSLLQLARDRGGAGGADEVLGATTQCTCPACGTTMQQRCLNCLGEGRVCLPA